MGKGTVEGVRRYWKAAAHRWRERAIGHEKRVIGLSADIVRMRDERAGVVADRDTWKKSAEKHYFNLRQKDSKIDELERINRDYERDLQHDTEMAQKAQERIWDTTDSIGRALRIIDKLTERGKS